MTTLLIIITAGILAAAVIQYIRRAESNSASLDQLDATLQAEVARRQATDKAEADAAAARKVAYDKKAHEVTTAADAARLLREASDDTFN